MSALRFISLLIAVLSLSLFSAMAQVGNADPGLPVPVESSGPVSSNGQTRGGTVHLSGLDSQGNWVDYDLTIVTEAGTIVTSSITPDGVWWIWDSEANKYRGQGDKLGWDYTFTPNAPGYPPGGSWELEDNLGDPAEAGGYYY